jgi:hypothetical protein
MVGVSLPPPAFRLLHVRRSKFAGNLERGDDAQMVRRVSAVGIRDVADEADVVHDESIGRSEKHIVNAVLRGVTEKGEAMFVGMR